MHQRGFTFLEVALAAAIMTVVAGVGLSMMLTGGKVYSSGSNRMSASARANGVMERILAELRMASINGEDLDRDNDPNDLDAEDLNGNGRIEDDWSLPDAETAEEITFNATRGSDNYSEPIRFFFDGERVYREAGVTNPERALLASDVTALTFTRQGRRITVNVVVQSGEVGKRQNGAEKDGAQTSLVRDVLLRN